MDLIDLEGLTPEERNIILSVIRRDDELRQRQDNRISQVKQELHNLRMNSVLRNGDDLKKMCARCKTPFGFITNTGDMCPVCRFRVCKNCRESLITNRWLCTLCYKENQLRWLSGDWMDKDNEKEKIKTQFNSGTDLVRASLRIKHPNGNLGGLEDRAAGHSNTGNNPLHHHHQRQQQQQQQQQQHRGRPPGQYAAHDAGSQDRKGPAGLSTLFDSIRSGLGGGGGDGDAADSFAGGAVGGGVGGAGCGVVVQHVSCRRRRDSGSSSDSDSESDRSRRSPAKAGGSATTKARQGQAGGGSARKVSSAETNGTASRPVSGDRRHKERYEGEGRGLPMYARGGQDTDEDSLRVSSLSHSLSSDASAGTVKEKRGGGGGGREEVSRLPVAKQRATNQQTRKSDIPQPVNRAAAGGGDGRQKRPCSGGPVLRQQASTSDAERPPSGCSFTSSEWGEVTPTESVHSLHTQDRKDDTGSALGQSSGYASASRRSVAEIGGDSNALSNCVGQQQNGSLLPRNEDSSPSPASAKSKASPSKLPVRKTSWHNSSRESADPEPTFAASFQPESHAHQQTPQYQTHSNTLPPQQASQYQTRSGDHLNEAAARSGAQTHIRRQSSGRSETWSIATSKTASPTTKMRLLDLASNRALERDGSDSVQSWSGGSDDTMSLGMSCSGVATSADAPVFQRVQYNKHRKGCEACHRDKDSDTVDRVDGRKATSGHEGEEEEEDGEGLDNTCADSAYSTAASSCTSELVHHRSANKNHDGGGDALSTRTDKTGVDGDAKALEGASSERDSSERASTEASGCAASSPAEDNREIQDAAAAEREDHGSNADEEEENEGESFLGMNKDATDEETIPEEKHQLVSLSQDVIKNATPEQKRSVEVTDLDESSDDVDSSVYLSSRDSTASPREENQDVELSDENLITSQQSEEAEDAKSGDLDLPFTMQRYFLVDDAASDVLSIISERTEPGDRGDVDDTDRDEDDNARFSDDSDSTVHDIVDEAWSDDDVDGGELENGSTTPRRMSVDETLGETMVRQSREDESVSSGILPNTQHDEERLGASGGSDDVPELEVSSTQTEEVFVISQGEKAKVQDFIRHMVEEALPKTDFTLRQTEDGFPDEQTADVQDIIQQVVGAVSKSTSQEDASSQTEDVSSDSELSQSLEQDFSFHEDKHQDSTDFPMTHTEAFLLEHECQVKPHQFMKYDKVNQIPAETALATTSDITNETAEYMEQTSPKDEDQRELQETRKNVGFQEEEIDSLDERRNDDAVEKEVMKTDLAPNPAGASTHDEAVFLDQNESDEAVVTRVSNDILMKDEDSDVHHNDDIERPVDEEDTQETIEEVKHNLAELELVLAAELMTDSDSMALDDETATQKLLVHRAYVDHADEEHSPQLSQEIMADIPESGEPVPPDTSLPECNSSHLSVTSSHDLDQDSMRRASPIFDEPAGFRVEGEAHSANSYLPDATVDLDDPNLDCSDTSSLVAAGGWNLPGSASIVQEAMIGLVLDGSLSEEEQSPLGGKVDFPASAEDDSLLDVPDLPGAHEAEVQYVPNIIQPPPLDGDGDQLDGGAVSPGLRPNSTTPKRGSPHRLSTPSMVTSHASSLDEKKSGDGTDDENIDELFAQHRTGSKLGISRSSIGSPSNLKGSSTTAEPVSNLARQKSKGVPSSRESLASVYSDAGEINYGRIPVSGDITFALEYDNKKSTLRILIKGCHDLAPVDVKHNRSDPYVKVYLLPDKTRSGKRKSKIKKHTLNPVYDEVLSYNISQGELENRVLWVTVWHSDRFGRNDFLGEVTIPMDTHRFVDASYDTYMLESRVPDTMNEEAMQYKGDLLISLMYITPDNVTEGKKSKSKSKSKKSKSGADPLGEIHVLIKEAWNLTAVRSNGTSDPFVKGYLLPDRGRNAKQKTPVMKNSVNPGWNHTLVFDGVDAMELADRSLELTVWDHEKLGTNEFLGGASLNLGKGVKGGHQVDWMDARGEESLTWQSMMERPNTWIDAKLPLRASMGKSSNKK